MDFSAGKMKQYKGTHNAKLPAHPQIGQWYAHGTTDDIGRWPVPGPKCRAENEIHVTGNGAVFKILAAAVQQNRILPPEETAVAEHRAVAVHADGQRLPDRARGVFKRDVFRREIIRVNERRRGAERAQGFAVKVGEVGLQIAGDDGGGRVFTHQFEKAFLALHIDQFPVDAGFDVNDHRMGAGARRHGHDGGLHIGELAAAVGGDNEVGLRRQAVGIEDEKNQRAQPGARRGYGQTSDLFHIKPRDAFDYSQSSEPKTATVSSRSQCVVISVGTRAVACLAGTAQSLECV